MRTLALDLSKSSTGWALASHDDEMPAYGHWELGIKTTPPGRIFANLHQRLTELHRETPIEGIFFERPLQQSQVSGNSNITNIENAVGLASHVQSWAYVMKCRVCYSVAIKTWRGYYLGPQPNHTKRKRFKELSIVRGRQLGFAPRNDDEADALGILDWAFEYQAIVPKWRSDEVLRPMMEVA